MTKLTKEIDSARKAIRQLKRTVPYIFVEYNEMLTAQDQLKQAQKQFKAAKRVWNKLGE